ncbi:response regulator transcription factor [Stenomitos frigidus]|uniref:DNA-binding response regulator n=1 Tax=Stenomitos frigidus ULC18 TaxID=2107698 RepID=A0A2T1EN06_9CYAN|nr:response regulator transcription factor [Stenomitos frigidus]PSB34130.1 DNA-binding response regulator [Stenomitos frigidus ULC18]
MIRLLLVEDQEIVRRGLKTLLQRKPDFQVVGEAGNGQEAIAILQSLYGTPLQPDVVLMDIRMPVMDGVEATQQICQQFPEVKVLVLTTFDDARYITEALRVGAKGYVLKDTPSKELADMVRSIHRGYTQFGPGILEKMIAVAPEPEDDGTPQPEPQSQPQPQPQSQDTVPQPLELPPGFTELTSREREVLCLIVAGRSNKEIAQQLCVTEGTARNHISHILTRLNVRDRTQAAVVASTFLSWLENPEAIS